MNKIKELLREKELKPTKYTKKGNATIVDTDNGRFVLKKKKNDNERTYNYLKSRNFNYFPNLIDANIDYEIYNYVEEVEIPNEQKLLDIIHIMSLLHNKTTYYKEVDEDKFKEIYETINSEINYLYNYYSDINTVIDGKVYMDPGEYLLARNISKVYAALTFCQMELESWYNIVKDKRKQRYVVLHNNLELSHLLANDNPSLISWDKSKVDIPIYDFLNLYKKHGLDYEFTDLLKIYESNYPLLMEERKLLFILISLPEKIEFNDTIFNNCKKISNHLDYLFKTEKLISPYYTTSKEKN